MLFSIYIVSKAEVCSVTIRWSARLINIVFLSSTVIYTYLQANGSKLEIGKIIYRHWFCWWNLPLSSKVFPTINVLWVLYYASLKYFLHKKYEYWFWTRSRNFFTYTSKIHSESCPLNEDAINPNTHPLFASFYIFIWWWYTFLFIRKV